jgi:hypothetical protein
MKNNKDIHSLIIRYFDNQLTDKEKEYLFSAIESDAELNKEFQSFKKVFDLTDEIRNHKIDDAYLNSIIPEFRKRIQNESRAKKYIPAFATIVLLIVMAVTVIFYSSEQKVDNFYSEVSEEELLQQLSQSDFDYIQDEKIDSLLSVELKTSPDKISRYVFNGDDIRNFYNNGIITNEDENEIYAVLIDRKF